MMRTLTGKSSLSFLLNSAPQSLGDERDLGSTGHLQGGTQILSHLGHQLWPQVGVWLVTCVNGRLGFSHIFLEKNIHLVLIGKLLHSLNM